MKLKHLMLGLFAITTCMSSVSQASEKLTLAEAMRKTLIQHPSLQVYDLREDALSSRRLTASLKPELELGIETENFAGSGEFSGFGESEWTITLSSVIEMGNKRASRIEAIDAQTELLKSRRQVEALDLLGAMASQFISALELSEQLTLAKESESLANKTIQTVSKRVSAGVAPDAELLRARAMASQATLRRKRVESELKVATVALSPYWNERRPPAREVVGDLFGFGPTRDFESLLQQVSTSPNFEVFASEKRVRDAAIQLAQSQSKSDLQWSVGARHFAELNDTAVVASLGIPLFSARRNEGELAALALESESLALERNRALNEFYVRLFDAYQSRILSIEAVNSLQTKTIPDLMEAQNKTRRAYESGRYSYLDLIAAQQSLLEAKAMLIRSARTALQAGVVIERLTGVSLSPEVIQKKIMEGVNQ